MSVRVRFPSRAQRSIIKGLISSIADIKPFFIVNAEGPRPCMSIYNVTTLPDGLNSDTLTSYEIVFNAFSPGRMLSPPPPISVGGT